MKILLGLTGSVASGLYQKLKTQLEELGEVKSVATEKAMYFINLANSEVNEIITDTDEWKWKTKGDSVLHIDLKDWADIFVIAPLSANTLGKITNGICDNLLTSIYRAWPIYKPIILAPAMNVDMWKHPITWEQLDKLQKRHKDPNYIDAYGTLRIIDPIKKELVCGVNEIGAMANIEDIIKSVKSFRSYLE